MNKERQKANEKYAKAIDKTIAEAPEPTCFGKSVVKCCYCKHYARPKCQTTGNFTRRKATCITAEKK